MVFHFFFCFFSIIETITFDAEGNMFAFTARGRIVQVLPDETVVEWANVGGRPISGGFDANGDLIVCDIGKASPPDLSPDGRGLL